MGRGSVQSGLIAGGWVLLLLLISSPVWADGGGPGATRCEDDAACSDLIERGYKASQEGRSADAQRAYERAYLRVPDAKILYNLARVHHKAGRDGEAASCYRRFLSQSKDSSDPLREKARQYLAQLPPDSDGSPAEAGNGKVPLYRKWWLWTAVGVAAAGIAVGVGLGVAAQQPDTSSAYVVRF